MTAGASMMESADDVSQLKQSLEVARQELSEAKETIARLKAENAELRRRAEQNAGNKNGQADDGEQGTLNAHDTAADSNDRKTKSDADENEEKKEDETPGSDAVASGMNESEEANAAHEAQHRTPPEESENNAQTQEDANEQSTGSPCAKARRASSSMETSVAATPGGTAGGGYSPGFRGWERRGSLGELGQAGAEERSWHGSDSHGV